MIEDENPIDWVVYRGDDPGVILEINPSHRTVFSDSQGEEMFVIDGDLQQFEVYGKVVHDPDQITKAFSLWVKQFLPTESF